MNAETSLWWSLFDLNVQAARERKVLRPSGADDLIPTDRLEFLASVTTTQYITLGRHATRGDPAGPGASGHETPSDPGAGSTPPTSPPAGGSPASPPPKEGDTHGEYTYHTCPRCNLLKPYKKWWPGARCWDCYRR